MTIKYKTIKEIKKMISQKEISNKEIVQEVYKLINENSHLNAFVTLNEENSIKQADNLDNNPSEMALAGIPIAQKDLFCTKGLRTTCGSKILDNFIPPYSATVIENLENAGCISVGKTNMDEFAMGSSNETSYFGNVHNPWGDKLVPGGSSGGSASAVAAGIVPAASGTDTGGSIRQPASLCGITGLKPTYGRVSRWGMIAFASSLDQAGPMARTVEDCALLLNEMCSHDIKDTTSLDEDIPNFENRAGAVTLDITMAELNTYSQNCSPTDPPILMSWPGALPRQLDEYIDLNNETNTELLADQIWDGERNLDPNWEAILKKNFLNSGGYQYFKMIVDEVSTRFNLANTVDDFEIITDKENYYSLEVLNIINNIRDDFNTYQANLDTTTFMPRQANDCANVEYYIDDLKWGLPVYLGLDGTEVTEEYKYDTGEFLETKGFYLPTYYYYNKTDSRYQPFKRPSSGGFSHSSIFLLVSKFQLDVKGEPYFFMDLDRLNCIDEVAPYKENEFSEMNNMSTGNPNSAFAKLPLSIQDEVAYSGSQITSKSYDPPLNRLSRLAIRLRFHNGRPVKFGIQPFSFVLEIKCSKQSLKLK